MAQFKQTKAPALVLPTKEYNQESTQQKNNQLRIYFNDIDSTNFEMIQAVNTLMALEFLSDN